MEYRRIFYLDSYFNPRNILIYEIRGDYKKYSNNKIIIGTRREINIILVVGIGSTTIESTSTNYNSLYLGWSSGRDSNADIGLCRP